MAQENNGLNEVLRKHSLTPEESYALSQNIARARKQAEGLPILGTGYIPNLFGGAASSFLRGVGDLGKFLNFNNFADTMQSGADYIDERLPPTKPAELSWDYISSPEGLLRGTGNTLGSIASIALPTLPFGGAIGTAARGLTSLTRGKIGLDAAKMGVRGAMTSIPEAGMEAGNFERDALANGMNPEEARQRSWGVFGRNAPFLMASNAAQWGLLPKLAGKGTGLKSRALTGAGELLAQGIEEGYQEGFQNEMAGRPYSYNPLSWTDPQYNKQLQAVKEGIAGFALPVLGGIGAGVVRDRYSKNDENEEFNEQPAGAFENKYWQKQHGKVSYEGAQPQTMKAIDALGKWYYEKTGVPLVVTSVTDGQSHQGGEHSHYNGWKFDVNDYGSGMEGALTTESGKKGWLADEFIKYGQSLGLGMNWEGNHIDVAVDGTQWEGKDAGKNFGGFKFKANVDEDAEKLVSDENDSDFTEKQNQMWRLAQYAAGRAKNKYGYEIPAELIYKQWVHESGANFDANKILSSVHNYGGLTQKEENDLPQPDGSNYYRKFNDDTEYANAYIDDFIKRYPEINGVKNEREFATVLKKHGYFGAEIDVYARDMEGVAVPKTKIKNSDSVSENEKTAERLPVVDEILKELLSKNIEPKLKIERQTPLTRAVYEDFVFQKMNETGNSESNFDKDFFINHTEFFDKDRKFINSPKNRELLIEHFGEDEINDFGQKLIAERINAIRNIQSPNNFVNFQTSEELNKKTGEKTFVAKLTSKISQEDKVEIEKLADEYLGERGKKSGTFNFKNIEDRNTFTEEAENLIQGQREKTETIENLENISLVENPNVNEDIARLEYLSKEIQRLDRELPERLPIVTDNLLAETDGKILSAEERQFNADYDRDVNLNEQYKNEIEELIQKLSKENSENVNYQKLKNLNNEISSLEENLKNRADVFENNELKALSGNLSEEEEKFNADYTRDGKLLRDYQREKEELIQKLVQEKISSKETQNSSESVPPPQTIEQIPTADLLQHQIESIKDINKFAPRYQEIKRLSNLEKTQLSAEEFTFLDTFNQVKKLGDYVTRWNKDLLRHVKEYGRLKELSNTSELNSDDENFVKIFENSFLEGQEYLREWNDKQQELDQLNQAIQEQRKTYYDLSQKINVDNIAPEESTQIQPQNLFSDNFAPNDSQFLQNIFESTKQQSSRPNFLNAPRRQNEYWQQKLINDAERSAESERIAKAFPNLTNQIQDISNNFEQIETAENISSQSKKPNNFSEQVINQSNLQLMKDMNVAMKATLPNNKAVNKIQSQAFLRIFDNPNLENLTGQKVSLPPEIKKGLEKNELNAIQISQQILHEATGKSILKNEENSRLKKIEGLSGNISTVASDNKKDYGIRYRIVEGKDLITSHEISGNNSIQNEKYPQELQPRDREKRAAMILQTIQMANKLRPNDLMESRNLNQGAPIVRNDGVVLNGNGRTMAINQAYKIGKSEDYKNTLINNAEKFGFNRSEVEKMQQPVLVREITNSLNDNDISEIINSTAGGSMTSATEKAKVDAKKISRATLEEYVENEGDIGDFTAKNNQAFVSKVIEDIVNQNEINTYVDKNGKVNSDGLNRAKRALFALAYDDGDLIARMSESTDDNVKNLTNALTDVAPIMAKLQYQMNNGSLHNYDIAKNISLAVQKLSSLRDENKPVSNYLKEQSLWNEHSDAPEMQEILKFIDENKKSATKISKFMKEIARGIEEQGRPNNISLNFGEDFEKESAPLLNIKNTSKLNVQMEVAPIRLQVGNENFGYIHLVKRHFLQIQNKGFKNAIDFINHTLNNFNQIYDQSHIHKKSGKLIKRFVLYCKGDESKGFIPLDLELENDEGNYYTIVSATPHNEKINGELIFDGSSRPSTVAADGSLIEDSNNKSGVVSPRADAKTNPPLKNISQNIENDKAKQNLEEIKNLWNNFERETAKEIGINLDNQGSLVDAAKNMAAVENKISEKLGNSNDVRKKLEFIGKAADESFITADNAYELAKNMLYGNAEEQATANKSYEVLKQAQIDKAKTDYDEAKADGTIKKILDKFPELENRIRDIKSLKKYTDGGEEYQAEEAIHFLDQKLLSKHGVEINSAAFSGKESKWAKVGNEIQKLRKDANEGKISYFEAYKKIKQILEDAGLEEGLSEEQINTQKKFEKAEQKQKEYDDVSAEIKKIRNEHDYEKYPLSQNLKQQYNEVVRKLDNNKISPQTALKQVQDIFNFAKKEKNTDEITIGDYEAADAYKISLGMNAADQKKFDDIMNKVVSYRNNQMTRREFVEEIAKGNIKESALKSNATAEDYLRFLKGHIPKAISAIKKAGLENVKAVEGDYIQDSGENSAAFIQKTENPANLESLKKLAKVFDGEEKINSNGKPVFEFDTAKNRNLFKDAASELFLPNKHLKYFKQEKTNTENHTSNNNFGSIEERRRNWLKSLGFEDKIEKKTSDDKVKITLKSPKFADNSKENRERVISEMQKEVNKISANPMFNPKIYSLGLELGAIYVQDGIDTVTEWTEKMINSVGEKVRPWLSSIIETIENIPEDAKFDEQQMTHTAGYIGALMESGRINSFEEALSEFEKDIGKENVEKYRPMFKAAYNGISKFFEENKKTSKDDTQEETQKRAGNSATPEFSEESSGKLPYSASLAEKSQMSDVTNPETNVQNDSENLFDKDISQATENDNKKESAQAEVENKKLTNAEVAKLHNQKKKQWEEYESKQLIKKIKEDGFKAELKIADRSGAVEITAKEKGGEELKFKIEVDKLNQTKDKEKFLSESILKSWRDVHNSIWNNLSYKEQTTAQAIMQNSSSILDLATQIHEDLKKRVPLLEQHGKKSVSESLQKMGVSINKENAWEIGKDAVKKLGLEKTNYTSGEFGITNNSFGNVVGDNGEIYSSDEIVELRKKFNTESEKADLEKFIKVAELLGGEYIGDSQFAFCDENEDILFYTKTAFGSAVHYIIKNEKSATESKQANENDNIEKLARDALKAAGLENKFAPSAYNTKIYKPSADSVWFNVQVFYDQNKNPISPTIKSAITRLYKAVTGEDEVHRSDIDENLIYYFDTEKDAQTFEKALDIYFSDAREKDVAQKAEFEQNFNTHVNNRANEALKATGLEGKTINTNFTTSVPTFSKKFMLLRGNETSLNFDDISDTKLKDAVHKLEKFFDTEAYPMAVEGKAVYRFACKSELDAKAFKKALDIYSGKDSVQRKIQDKLQKFQNGSVNKDAAIYSISKLLKESGESEEFAEQQAKNIVEEFIAQNGGAENESIELGESGSVNGGYRVPESEIRPTTDEEKGQKGNDTVFEGISGHERQTLSTDESNDIGTNAESERPVSKNGTRESSPRNSAGNGLRGNTETLHATGNLTTALHNFKIAEDSEIGRGGLKEKFKQNIDAIKLLKQIESEGRFATPEEQKILAKFNGWGTLANVFSKDDWKKERDELKEILTEDEYKAANSAITNAFYTPVKITQVIWKGLDRLGFKGGRILDPSMGTGIFFGTMPAEIASRSELRGIELDDLTGRISKQLYQKAAIDIKGFQEVHPVNNFFDLVISNVPFETVRPYDKEYKKQNYQLHNYFFAKAMDKVRPGGFVVFITSTGTMQNQTAESKQLRAEMESKADLIAAFKLPDTTFDKNSNTKVTSDVLILRKRLDPNAFSPYRQNWQEIKQINVEGTNSDGTLKVLQSLPVNEYFINNPEHMIGKPVEDRLTAKFGTSRLALDGTGTDVAEKLSELMEGLPENIFVPVQPRQHDAVKNTQKIIYNSAYAVGMEDLSFFEKDGKIYQAYKNITPDGRLTPAHMEIDKNQDTIRDYLKLMKATKNLMSAQLSPETTDKKLEELRGTLRENYENFTSKHGYINAAQNTKILGSDPNYGQVAAIEKYTYDKKTKKEIVEKSDIFTKRTTNAITEPTSARTVLEGLSFALSMRGFLDMDYIKKLTGKTEDEIVKELGDNIFKNPETKISRRIFKRQCT